MDSLHIQTLKYRKLSIAGHLTIFHTRTRGTLLLPTPRRCVQFV